MTVTKDQAHMLVTLAAAVRPHGARRWDTAGTLAALEKVRDRNLGDVILATIRAAADRDVDSPGVIPTNGPHWREQLAPASFVPRSAAVGTRCTACGRTSHTGATDHEFTLPREKLAPDVIHAAIAALREDLPVTKPPTPTRTLDELAEANPALHERVDALRAALPVPAMRETEPTEESETA